ncbi:hypothetical protein CYMTET_26322 [Cymbomonas tetramitiformis]|uniref:Lipase maturation factor 1/2 C-terminal domain-containing protein n=1 Tax=Cymbomonas tetramitiformis TaxID=36881 RepID=A0AAE0KYC0_9CHLO|nr:hypothetical protein CYMTET_26322 [Cymbomonas tetramitiformis]
MESPPPDCFPSLILSDPVARGNAPLQCHQVAGMCHHPQHGKVIRDMCPATCRQCKLEHPGGDEVTWQPLEFKNLPGRVDRAPSFNSPYHYRLDWEMWIHTTARMEGQRGLLPVPAILEKLAAKVLLGDTDAADLVATPRRELFNSTSGPPHPPSALRASFYHYTFSDWDQLWHHGVWWRRKPVPGSQPAVWLAKDIKHLIADTHIVRSHVNRGWVLLGSILGAVGAFGSLCSVLMGPLYPNLPIETTPKDPRDTNMVYCILVLGGHIGCFVLALVSDESADEALGTSRQLHVVCKVAMGMFLVSLPHLVQRSLEAKQFFQSEVTCGVIIPFLLVMLTW